MTRRVLCAVLAAIMIVCLLPLHTMEAHATSTMKASDKVIAYLKSMEGFIAIPKWDYVQWTVGYGNRCPDEHLQRYLRDGIPIDEADALFLEQLADFEEYVNNFIDKYDLTVTQNQYDAILSVTYNCGPAWLSSDNDLKNAVVNGSTGNTFIGVLSQRCTAGGTYLAGLMRRRLTEADMYLNGTYYTQIPADYCYVFFDAGEGKATAVAQGYDCNLYAVPLVTASREGYTFLGWYTSEVGGVKVTCLDENLDKTTLYAHWAVGDGQYTPPSMPDENQTGTLVTITGDVVNVRSGPGINYPVVSVILCGEAVVISTVTTVDGRLWGQFDQGWICLDYTTYGGNTSDSGNAGGTEGTIPEDDGDSYSVPVCATIVGSDVALHNGPDTSYPKVGQLEDGSEILIVETYKMLGVWWGRIENGGWLCLDRYVLLQNDQMLAHNVEVTVTNAYLNVRGGPGTGYGWVSSLVMGDVVEILAVEIVDDEIWGRFYGGWISLEFTDFDPAKLEQYRNHSYGQWYESVKPTCVSYGQERRDCALCDAYELRNTETGDHEMGDWYVTVEPEYNQEGQERRDCALCDYYETRTVESSEHDFGDWQVIVAPTCEETGLMQRECALCGHTEQQTMNALGHAFTEWEEIKAATCTESGERRRECQICGQVENETMQMLGHTFCDWYITKEPTYESVGQERRDCENCGAYEVREKEFDGQVNIKVFATITTTSLNVRSGPDSSYGWVAYVYYGDRFEVYEQQTAESGKVWGRIDKGWICLTGYTTLEEVVEVIAHTHSFGDWYYLTEPTCTEGGSQRRDCDGCSHYETRTVSATGHNYGDWYTIREATAAQSGLKRRDCGDCDHFEEQEIPYQEETVTKIYGTLTGNDYLNIRAGAGIGYDLVGKLYYGDRVEIFEIVDVGGKEWGRIEQGWIQLTGYITLEVVEETVEHIHTMSEWTILQAATCTQNGEKCRVCVECAYMESQSIAATGHSFGAWYTVREATASEKGLERRECANCDHYEQRETAYQGTPVTRVYATIICSVLNVRSGPGTGYGVVGTVTYGTVHEVLEQTTVSGKVWGRISAGWICLTDNTTLEEVEEESNPSGHSFVDGKCEFCGEPDPNWYVQGDVNGDGVINYLDAMQIAMYYVGQLPADDLDLRAADVNGDGVINYLDAMRLAMFYVGQIDSLIPEN